MIDYLLSKVEHKHNTKTTTTLKLKKDLWNLIMKSNFEGNILEVGCDVGNTTYILGNAAVQKAKRVYSYEIDEKRIEEAKSLCRGLSCEFIKKDVYNEPWDVSNIGFVFIDASHENKDVALDLENAFKLVGKSGVVVIHDYGLVTRSGSSVKSVIENNEQYEIVQFLGEEKDWNNLGSGKVIDWEAVQVKLK